MAIFKFRNMETGQATPVPEGEFTIGRNDDVYIHLEDSMVSRRHATLFNTAHGIFIEDAGSGNGTIVRGVKITGRTQLELGDQVQIGSLVFRVDPERKGETSNLPLAEVRPADRAYMKRDTERLPLPGEPARVVETIPPDKLVAPEVNPADAEAEELNAIVIREPEAADPMRLPILRRGQTPLPGEAQAAAPRLSVPVPAPAPQTQSAPKPRPELTPPHPAPPENLTPAVNPSLQATTLLLAPGAVLAPKKETDSEEKKDEASSRMSLGWAFLIFLAGMGVGLLVGLIFAKIFIEMGGKIASLP